MAVPLDLTCDELLSTTRAVRRGLDLTRPVDLEVVKECLRLALQAPNGSNRQRWRWIVLTDPALRSRVADVYRRAFHDRMGPALDRLDEAEASVRRLLTDGRDLAEKLHRVPVLVVPCLELDSERLPEGNQAGVWSSLLPAMWSYALAARSRGLATTWTTVHLDREKEVAELLGLPKTVHQGGLLPTAHSLRTRFGPGPRLPLEEVLHIDGWNGETRVEARP
ncbi:oxidoreductase [Streptosporangium carneum]|uniref:Oxidoreductase n=1 Tax=Streptosporangium carneum TaxID=47481 RepID=A0A9W6I8S0_9ACTN|nr:oxidoreductase [Streptosporangium carneum]